MLGSTSDLSTISNFPSHGRAYFLTLTPAKTWVLVNDFRLGFLDNLSDKPQSECRRQSCFTWGRSTCAVTIYAGKNVCRLWKSARATGQVCDSINDFQVRTKSHFYLIKPKCASVVQRRGRFFSLRRWCRVSLKVFDIEDPTETRQASVCATSPYRRTDRRIRVQAR